MGQSHHLPPRTSSQNLKSVRAARLRLLRQEVRRAGSCFLDACQLLEGGDYATAARMVDGAERLLARLGALERRAS